MTLVILTKVNCSLFSIHYSLTISVFSNHLHPVTLIDLRKRIFWNKDVWRILYPEVSSEIYNNAHGSEKSCGKDTCLTLFNQAFFFNQS